MNLRGGKEMKQGNAMSGKLHLKNKHERESWLLHLLDGDPEPYIDLSDELGVKIYRYNFENGAALIITRCSSFRFVAGVSRLTFYDILTPLLLRAMDSWHMNGISYPCLLDWLHDHRAEI